MRTILTFLLALPLICFSQQTKPVWHDTLRTVHYLPDGKDFVLVNGHRRFNRALYGGNTGFRVEAGDLPEFALYLPGMGGNLKFGIISNGKSKWLTNFSGMQSRYRPGSMNYQLEDSILGKGKLMLTVMSLFDGEGILVKLESKQLPVNIQLLSVFGGATGLKFSRDGDIGADPESSFYLQPGYCKDNIFRTNGNSFELLFGSKKPLSEEERYEIQHTPSNVNNGSSKQDLKSITGIFPLNSKLRISDASHQDSPLSLLQTNGNLTPVLASTMDIAKDSVYYFFIQSKGKTSDIGTVNLSTLWEKTENYRRQLAERIEVITPDPYINTLGGALSVAADAVWEDPSYMHGAIAWRMRLNGWRGAYVADVLGWHDRARKNFSSYALSQLTSPASAPVVMDTALHLARGLEKLGTSMFSSGYISRNPNGDFRPHHYDMNLVFIDQLLNHFQWTGDTAYIRQCWPLLKRHVDWEKRNFDTDDDGLYDSYAAIWASDALQYSGGGVTHSSAYNFRTNSMMAKLAILMNEDPQPFAKEAEKIFKAINRELWQEEIGSYAEYKDLLGKRLLHSSAGLWTIYHITDSRVSDQFQAYQLQQYVQHYIPHIPIKAKGIADSTLYTLSTTNWQPYTWSLNNVALAELMHTALSFWQAGNSEEAYKLWKSSLIESMYIGASPGNIQQLSFYDAIRGELYRDFADPIAMTARSLVEGLFGIVPDALKDTLFIQPGLPATWKTASLKTPDVSFSFQRDENLDSYIFQHNFPTKMQLSLRLKARAVSVSSIVVNGISTTGHFDTNAVGQPELIIQLPYSQSYEIKINWSTSYPEMVSYKESITEGDQIELFGRNASMKGVYDPQQIFNKLTIKNNKLGGTVIVKDGKHSFFIKLQQGDASWWQPVNLTILPAISIRYSQGKNSTKLIFLNNATKAVNIKVSVNHSFRSQLNILPTEEKSITLNSNELQTGSNLIKVASKNHTASENILNWSLPVSGKQKFEKINLSSYYNEEVNNIFKQAYLSPRPIATVLQLPTQGIGNWAYPLTRAIINDSIFRSKVGRKNEFKIKAGVPFSTPGEFGKRNILFTSQWDNFPDSIIIPLRGKSSHAYFLMAGSTNPMQSRMINGEIYIKYQDGTMDRLLLKNPENWWPIEQDYYVDGYAFTTDAPRPLRVYFKNGLDSMEYGDYESIRGFSNKAVKNGAATVLDLPLNPNKEIKELVLRTVTNDVVIGLMSVTLLRP